MWQNSSKHPLFSFFALGFWLVLLSPSVLWAKASFLIWPIYPVIESGDRAAALWLENTGHDAALIQVRVFKWDQQGQEDVYSEQADVMPSPPMIRIEPGKKQMIRLTRREASPARQEEAYRVVVDELPAKFDQQGQRQRDADNGVQFQMRYSIPLFTYGAGLGSGDDDRSKRLNQANPLAQPLLSWRLVTKAGQDYLSIQNQGLLHVRLSHFQAGDTEAEAKIGTSTFGYVLAQKERLFVLDARVKKALANGLPLYGVMSSARAPMLIQPAP